METLCIKPTTVLETIILVNNIEVVEMLEFEITPIVQLVIISQIFFIIKNFFFYLFLLCIEVSNNNKNISFEEDMFFIKACVCLVLVLVLGSNFYLWEILFAMTNIPSLRYI